MSTYGMWSLFRKSLSELTQSVVDDHVQQTVDQEIAILQQLHQQTLGRLDQAINLRDYSHKHLVDLRTEKTKLEQEIVDHLQNRKRSLARPLAEQVATINQRIDKLQVQWEGAKDSVRAHESEVKHLDHSIQRLKHQLGTFQASDQLRRHYEQAPQSSPGVTTALEAAKRLQTLAQKNATPFSETPEQVLKRLRATATNPPPLKSSARNTSPAKPSPQPAPKSKRLNPRKTKPRAPQSGDHHD